MSIDRLYVMWKAAVRAQNWHRAKMLATEIDKRRTNSTEGK